MTIALLFAHFLSLAFAASPIAAQTAQSPLWSYAAGDDIRSVSISSDGSYIAAGSDDGKVYLFSSASSTPVWSYTTGGWVRSVAISPDGNYLVAGSYDGNVYLFSRSSSTPFLTYDAGEKVVSVSISSDGSYIVAGSWDTNAYYYSYSKISVFSRTSSTPLWTHTTDKGVDGSEGLVNSVKISSDGNYISAASADNVLFFSRGSSTPSWTYDAGNVGTMNSAAISANGGYIAAGDYDDVPTTDGKVYLFTSASATPSWSYTVGDSVTSVAVSSAGDYIAAGSWSNRVYLFSNSSSTPTWNYNTGNWVESVAISSDGSYIAAGTTGTFLFSRSSSAPLWKHTSSGVYSVAISDNGSYIVSGGVANQVNLFNVAVSTGENAGTAENQVAFTFTFLKSDGSPLSSTTIYWGTEDGKENTLLGTTDSQGILTSSENFAGKLLYIASSDNVYHGTKYVSLSGETSSSVSMYATGTPTTPQAPSSDLIVYVIILAIAGVAVTALVLVRGKKA